MCSRPQHVCSQWEAGRGGGQVTAGFHTSGWWWWWWWGWSWNNDICLTETMSQVCMYLEQNFMTWVPILKPSALSKGVNRLDWATLAWQKTKKTIPFTGTKQPPLQPPTPIATTPPFHILYGHKRSSVDWGRKVFWSKSAPLMIEVKQISELVQYAVM